MIKEITQEVLRKFGYTKNPTIAHVPSFPNVMPARKTGDYLKEYKGWVYANVKRRSEQMASVDLKLMRVRGKMVEEVFDHPAIDVLEEVNGQMSQRELYEITHSHLDLAGEAFWYVIKNGLKPAAITPLIPDRVTVIPGKERLIKGYIYKFQDADGVWQEMPFEPEEIVFIKEPDPNNLFRGMSSIRAAALAIDNDNSAEEWHWNTFISGMSGKPTFETTESISEDALRKMYTEIQQHWSGKENANKPMILHSGMKASAIGMTAKDMEYLEGQKWTRDKIMALMGTTKTILGITDDVNRSNAETAEYVFSKYMVTPRIKKFVGALNEFYLPMFTGTDQMFFMNEDPTPPNIEQEIELFKASLAGASWMTPNEVREKKGMDPVEGGDVLLIPNQLISVDAPRRITEELRFYNSRHRKAYLVEKRLQDATESARQAFMQGVKPIAKQILIDRTNKLTFRERATKDGGYQDQCLKSAINYEKRLKVAMQHHFEAQKKATLNKVDALFEKAATYETKSPGDKFLPEFESLQPITIRTVLPIITLLIQEQGNESLFFIGSNIGINTRSGAVQDFIEKFGLDLVKGIDETTKDRLKKQINEGLDIGESAFEIKDRIRLVFDNATDSRAEAIARTEITKAQNFASKEAWKQSGVVEAKEWLTAKDEIVDSECAALDGTIVGLSDDFLGKGDEVAGFIANDSIPQPPLHVNCRCVLLPVIKNVKSIKRYRGVSEKDVQKLQDRIEQLHEIVGV